MKSNGQKKDPPVVSSIPLPHHSIALTWSVCIFSLSFFSKTKSMKQHHETPPPTTLTTTTMSHSITTPSRFRAKQLEGHAGVGGVSSVSLSPALKARPKPQSPDVKSSNSAAIKSRRSLVLNKPKSPEDSSSQKADQVKVLGRSRRKNENDEQKKKKQSEEKLFLSENLIKDLQSEVLSLKEELDKAQTLKAEMEKQNQKLVEDLVAAEARIAALSSHEQREAVDGEHKSPKFKNIQKLIANKLERKEGVTEATSIKPPPSGPTHPISKPVADVERKPPACPSLPPPPPPPLRPLARAAATQKASSIVQLYHSLTKQEVKRDHLNRDKPAVFSAHSSIVGEIQNRSAHLLAIKADIETKGDFINSLIQKVLAAAYTDIEDILKFVDWLDGELSSLADERAVLKHFNWPERKADAMREAAIEYRDLKLLELEISSYKDNTNIPCGAALKKMASLLDKSERSIQRLVKLRNSAMHSYQDCKIPVDWMLDSGIVSKIKQASMKLAQMYMKRVTVELELVRSSDRESTQEALLLQGVHFAYRAHQFAGGLDSETLCAFEEIRQRVPGQLGGSRELLVGIPSS